jgi:succinate-acetate transporter protein
MALFGFATGTWMAGAIFGGFVTPAAEVPLAIVLIVFAGIVQFIGGLFAFRRANALTSNAFCCYGAFNTVVGVIILLEAVGFMPLGGSTATIVGWFSCSFSFISIALTLAALRRNMVSVGIFGSLACGYALTGISQFFIPPHHLVSSASAAAEAGGELLFVAAFLAFYMGMALVVNSTWKRTLLPLFGQA